MNRRKAIIGVLVSMAMVLAILLLGLGVGIGSAHPGTVYVDGTQGNDVPGCGLGTGAAACKTISYAITIEAADGDTIQVADGAYAEDLVINTPNLIIQSDNGAASTLIRGTGAANPVISLVAGADGVTFGTPGRGFTVDPPAGNTFLFEVAALLTGVRVEDNVFDSTATGTQVVSVGAAGATGLNINSNTTTMNDGDVAVDCWGPMTNLVVDNNTITGPANGNAGSVTFVQVAVNGATISNNTITGATSQMQMGAATAFNNITYSGNTFDDNVGAILLQEAAEGAAQRVSNLTVSENTFNDCGALDSYAFLILFNVEDTDLDYGTISLNFNNVLDPGGNTFEIVSNDAADPGIDGVPDLDAENNWWRCNAGPGGAGCASASADVDYDPWLVLNISANPASIVADGSSTSTITADMTENSDGFDTSILGHIPDGTEIIFTTNRGSIGSLTTTKTTTDGKAQATLTSYTGAGTATVTASAPPHIAAATATTHVQFRPGAPYTLTLTADPTSVPPNGTSTSTITALVLDEHGNNVADGTQVLFGTDLGSLDSLGSTAVIKSTLNGIATATLISGTVEGIATVTGFSAGVSDQTVVEFTWPYHLYLPLILKNYTP